MGSIPSAAERSAAVRMGAGPFYQRSGRPGGKSGWFRALGGFHLALTAPEELRAIAKAFTDRGVRYCAATHCTGDPSKAAFREVYGERFLPLGVGRVVGISADGTVATEGGSK